MESFELSTGGKVGYLTGIVVVMALCTVFVLMNVSSYTHGHGVHYWQIILQFVFVIALAALLATTPTKIVCRDQEIAVKSLLKMYTIPVVELTRIARISPMKLPTVTQDAILLQWHGKHLALRFRFSNIEHFVAKMVASNPKIVTVNIPQISPDKTTGQ